MAGLHRAYPALRVFSAPFSRSRFYVFGILPCTDAQVAENQILCQQFMAFGAGRGWYLPNNDDSLAARELKKHRDSEGLSCKGFMLTSRCCVAFEEQNS